LEREVVLALSKTAAATGEITVAKDSFSETSIFLQGATAKMSIAMIGFDPHLITNQF
jgi:hypothetical protein